MITDFLDALIKVFKILHIKAGYEENSSKENRVNITAAPSGQ